MDGRLWLGSYLFKIPLGIGYTDFLKSESLHDIITKKKKQRGAYLRRGKVITIRNVNRLFGALRMSESISKFVIQSICT